MFASALCSPGCERSDRHCQLKQRGILPPSLARRFGAEKSLARLYGCPLSRERGEEGRLDRVKLTMPFGDLLAFVYHCFDRIVICGYLSGLSRPEQVVYFFRQVVGVPVVSKEVLSQRTADYQAWVEAFARNHRLPIEWAEKGVRKEDHVVPWQRRMARKRAYGVYYIFKSMEQGPTFRVSVPKYPTKDPHHRILAPQRSRFTHYYFYIRDETLGPMVMRVGLVLPVPDHLLPQRPQLHRAGAEPRADRLPQDRQRLPRRRRHDDDPVAAARERTSIVAPAQPSPAALRKRASKLTANGGPVHSFQSLLRDLATCTLNEMTTTLNAAYSFTGRDPDADPGPSFPSPRCRPDQAVASNIPLPPEILRAGAITCAFSK
jgi:hypothetical protein